MPLSSVGEVGVALQALMSQAVPMEEGIISPFFHVVPGVDDVPPQPVPDLRRAATHSKDSSVRPSARSALTTGLVNNDGDHFVGALSALSPVLSTNEFKAAYSPHGNTPWFDGGLAEDADEWRDLWRGSIHASNCVTEYGFNATMFDFLGSSAAGLGARSPPLHGRDDDDKIANTELLLPIRRDITSYAAEADARDRDFKYK